MWSVNVTRCEGHPVFIVGLSTFGLINRSDQCAYDLFKFWILLLLPRHLKKKGCGQ